MISTSSGTAAAAGGQDLGHQGLGQDARVARRTRGSHHPRPGVLAMQAADVVPVVAADAAVAVVEVGAAEGALGSLELALAASDNNNKFQCGNCGQVYKHLSSLSKHRRWECGIEPQFSCPYCPHRAKRKQHLQLHIYRHHTKERQNAA